MGAVTASGAVVGYGNPIFECAGAHIRALARQLANVVTVTGTIDVANLDRVVALVRRFVLTEKSFVLDLSGIESIPAQATSLLNTLADACERAGVEWAVIAGGVAREFLFGAGLDDEVLVVDSVPDALQHFADASTRRRTMLLPLLNRTA
jgi:anti-anti-sigma regulatory factor